MSTVSGRKRRVSLWRWRDCVSEQRCLGQRRSVVRSASRARARVRAVLDAAILGVYGCHRGARVIAAAPLRARPIRAVVRVALVHTRVRGNAVVRQAVRLAKARRDVDVDFIVLVAHESSAAMVVVVAIALAQPEAPDGADVRVGAVVEQRRRVLRLAP